MRALAEEPLTDEQIKAFEREREKTAHQYDDSKPKRKSKGEKKRAKRDRRKYGYC